MQQQCSSFHCKSIATTFISLPKIFIQMILSKFPAFNCVQLITVREKYLGHINVNLNLVFFGCAMKNELSLNEF